MLLKTTYKVTTKGWLQHSRQRSSPTNQKVGGSTPAPVYMPNTLELCVERESTYAENSWERCLECSGRNCTTTMKVSPSLLDVNSTVVEHRGKLSMCGDNTRSDANVCMRALILNRSPYDTNNEMKYSVFFFPGFI